MDLNTGLTQALSDGTNHYIYGLGRIAQVNTTTEYFLGDALGSVRQLTDASGEITYSRAYDPYGVVSSTGGTSQSAYGYTGESYGDSTELLYLRSRFYASGTGRFLTRDTWGGDYDRPLSFNRWMYVEGNPVNLTDPSGYTSSDSLAASCAAITSLEKYTFLKFGVSDTNMKGWTCDELEQVLDEVDQFDRAVNGGLSSIFTRTISVKRVNKDKWCAYYYWYGTIEVQNPFTTKCAAGTLGHELAHAWDNQQGISSKFAKYVGASKSWGKYNVGNETPPLYGGGDPPSAFEDFAESVTEYVYDQKDQERIPTTEKRWKFVETLLDTGTILTSTSNTTSSNCSPTALGALESLWN
jgi:RHS repeat-associated protein